MHSSVRKVASFEPVSWHLGEDATRQRSSGSIQSHGIINRLRSYTVKACTLYIKDHTVRIHWVLGNFFFRERYLHIINVSPTRKKTNNEIIAERFDLVALSHEKYIRQRDQGLICIIIVSGSVTCRVGMANGYRKGGRL